MIVIIGDDDKKKKKFSNDRLMLKAARPSYSFLSSQLNRGIIEYDHHHHHDTFFFCFHTFFCFMFSIKRAPFSFPFPFCSFWNIKFEQMVITAKPATIENVCMRKKKVTIINVTITTR